MNPVRLGGQSASGGQWMRRSFALVALLLSLVGLGACGGSSSSTVSLNDMHTGRCGPLGCTTDVPVSTGPGASTSVVKVIRPTGSIDAALDAAIVAGYSQNDNYGFSPGCHSVRVVTGSIHVAEVRATGTFWALAGFAPGKDCSFSSADPGPFTMPGPSIDLFEKSPGQAWEDTTSGFTNHVGYPFPCPNGLAGSVVPPKVLKAWDIPYHAPGCVTDVLPIPG